MDRRFGDRLVDQRLQRFVEPERRAVGAHPAGVRPLVPVMRALVIARERHRSDGDAVRDCTDAGPLHTDVDGIYGKHHAIADGLREQNRDHGQRLLGGHVEKHLEVAQPRVIDTFRRGHEPVPRQQRAHHAKLSRGHRTQVRPHTLGVELMPHIRPEISRPVRDPGEHALARRRGHHGSVDEEIDAARHREHLPRDVAGLR